MLKDLATIVNGSVASMKATAWRGVRLMRRSPHGQTEDVFDEHGLSGDVVLRYPPHLSLANHVHRFDPLKRSPCRVEGPKALTRSKAPLYGSVILLNDVVQVSYWSTTTASTEVGGPSQFRYSLRVRRIPVHVDHSWSRMTGRTQGFLKKTFGRNRVTLRAQEKVDRCPCGIHHPI